MSEKMMATARVTDETADSTFAGLAGADGRAELDFAHHLADGKGKSIAGPRSKR
jgi:hypothetical protein